MNWTNVAIIADSQKKNLMIVERILTNEYDVRVGKVEVFIKGDSADEAVKRVKESGYRIIFAICINTCVQLICDAYRHGLYGPRIVWILQTNANVVNRPGPDWCTSEMKAAVMLGAFQWIVRNPNFEEAMTSLGMTGKDLYQYQSSRPGFDGTPYKDTFHLCADAIGGAIFALNHLEQNLQRQNLTLIDFKGRSEMLFDDMKKAMTEVEIDLFTGHFKLENGDHTSRSPQSFDQVYNLKGERHIVVAGLESDALEKVEFFNEFQWKTPDGLKPNDFPIVVSKYAETNLPASIVLSIVCFILIPVSTTFGVKNYFKQPGYRHLAINALMFNSGIALILLMIGLYPFIKIGTVCFLALPVMGFAVLTLGGAVYIRLSAKVDKIKESKSKTAQINKKPRAIICGNEIMPKRKNVIFVACLMAIFIMVIVVWYVAFGKPLAKEIVTEMYNYETDTMVRYVEWNCAVSGNVSFESFIFLGLIALVQAIMQLSIVGLSLTKKNSQIGQCAARAKTASGLFLPAIIASILVVTIIFSENKSIDTIYYIASPILIIVSMLTTFLMKVPDE